MIISFWLPKGGSCKTSLTLTMAGALASQGRRVLVVDRDPQGGALICAKRAADRNLEMPFVVARAHTRGFDDVLFDHAPTLPDEHGFPAELVVLPTLLDAHTVPLLAVGLRTVRQLGMPHLVIPCRVRTDRAEQRERLRRDFPDMPFIRDRAIYPNSYGRGQTIYSEGLGMSHAKQAQTEANSVLAVIALAHEAATRRAA
jgi:chromosome partitioning protein